MPFPPQQQPGQPQMVPVVPKKPEDGEVDSYSRVVNGKTIKVNAYAKKSSTTTSAAKKVRMRPGRPRMMGQPGSYSSGRDIPGMKALPKPEPKVMMPDGQQFQPSRPPA